MNKTTNKPPRAVRLSGWLEVEPEISDSFNNPMAKIFTYKKPRLDYKKLETYRNIFLDFVPNTASDYLELFFFFGATASLLWLVFQLVV